MSYAQRFEDLYLARCFGERDTGFYIDVGAGHPVFDNVSFAFYLRGWSGITVEPNPALARLCRAVRPRDIACETLVGAEPGEAMFYIVSEFHGFSTVLAAHADAARKEFGKESHTIVRPMVTLAQLCELHAPAAIDFLKVDVEGLEAAVLAGNDWRRFRPKVVVVEALAAHTQTPAWDQWEPLLAAHGYSYACFDSLNRYYVAEEASELAARLQEPPDFSDVVLFRDCGPPLEDATHPDADLARRLARAALTRLPILDRALLLELATAEISPQDLDREASLSDAEAVWIKLFGRTPERKEIEGVLRAPPVVLRDVYARIIDGDAFRAACGRISASYAW